MPHKQCVIPWTYKFMVKNIIITKANDAFAVNADLIEIKGKYFYVCDFYPWGRYIKCWH